MLVGFQDQGNLGLGYLAAVLQEHGFTCVTIDINRGPDEILKCVSLHDPLIIGFSLIFQYYLPKFAALAEFLQTRGVACHMTVGGHYPSLCYEQILSQIPQFESVVLFEGEYSLLELAQHLANQEEWRGTQGIAYRQNGRTVLNPLRPLLPDLDVLPFPYRPSFASDTLGKKIQPMLATRGCARNCVFCSIREFYSRAPGKRVRRRSPANVVAEMKMLHEDNDVSIFLFQDDDFPVIGNAGNRWVSSFIEELERNGLIGKVVWKISCRVDEIDATLFAKMRDAGLYSVYLGIESGTTEGLQTLNKQVSTDDILQAVAMLKRLGIMFAYGFMLFDPGSTFDSVRANARFLNQIVGDGCAPVVFCKMLPYAGTPISETLGTAGRLRGTVVQPDYDFLDPALDEFYSKLNTALNAWVYGEDAVSHYLNLAWHEVAIIKRLFPLVMNIERYVTDLRDLTRQSNERVLTAVELSASTFERGREFPLHTQTLDVQAAKTVKRMLECRNAFVQLNQDRMLASLRSAVA